MTIIDRNEHVSDDWSYDVIYSRFYAQFVTSLAEYADLEIANPPKTNASATVSKCSTWLNIWKSLRPKWYMMEEVHRTGFENSKLCRSPKAQMYKIGDGVYRTATWKELTKGAWALILMLGSRERSFQVHCGETRVSGNRRVLRSNHSLTWSLVWI
jgi:hypothetical protein